MHGAWHVARSTLGGNRDLDGAAGDAVEAVEGRRRQVGGGGAIAGGQDCGEGGLLPRGRPGGMAEDAAGQRDEGAVGHERAAALAAHAEGGQDGDGQEAERVAGPLSDGRIDVGTGSAGRR